MQYGCIAERLGHSFSREIHAALADYRYELCEVASEDLDAFLTKRDFRGINVTIPYKERVIPYLFCIDGQAQRIGAVNTVVNRNGKLYGYNTDFFGMQALIAYLGISLEGKKVAILGTGGTSKTAHAVAESLGAREILTVSRQAREGCVDYETLKRAHADIQVLINTTPVGMFPSPDAAAVDITDFGELCGVVDAVYNPLRTQLVLDARKRGIPAEGGLFMLVAQAVRASEIFRNISYPEGTVERVFRQMQAQKENIVLIGMPAAGKSTVGAILAERLGRAFIDLDAAIVGDMGEDIPRIFARAGEEGFREIESRILKREAQRTGAVIATGGGAILRDENVNALRRNGRLYFLDRPLDCLIPTDDRPLASTREAIERRFAERYPRYLSVADLRVDASGDADDVADTIEKEHFAKQ